MTRTKGFTLIELLAVIVILAIIALIAIPLIMNVISEAKKGAFKDTVYGIIGSVENEYITSKLADEDDKKVIYTYENSVESSSIEGKSLKYKGTKPQAGNILITKDGNISLALYSGEYCATKSLDEDEIQIEKTTSENCVIEIPTAKIVLTGDDMIEVNYGDEYNEPGYIAYDSEGNEVTGEVAKRIYKNNIEQTDINTNEIGEYTVKYVYENAEDYIEVQRIIKIIDNQVPTLTIPADTEIKTTEVASFDFLDGVSVTDNSGEEIEVEVTSNLSNIVGVYTITYKAVDSSGNEITAIRNITVIKASYLRTGTNALDTAVYLGGPITKGSIESIVFSNTNTVSTDAIGSWDVSSDHDGSIIAWYKDADADELYELTIGSQDKIYANANSSYLFQRLTNLSSIDLSNFDTSNVTNMSYLFYGCSSLTSLDVTNFDTSNVTNMSYMFYGCNHLTSLNVSNFYTSNVTNMSNMFGSCSSLTSLDVANFDTSNVTNMSNMFYNCSSLTNIDVSNFDTSNVTNMNSMFKSMACLISLDVNSFDTSKVTDMSSMFSSLIKLNSLSVSNFDTSSVLNMAGMFYNMNDLITLDLSNFDTSKVTDMSNMFNSMDNLISVDISSFDTSNVTTMYFMFASTKISVLDLSNFDTSKVTNMSLMFNGCSSLTSIDISSFNTSNVINMYGMFVNTKVSELDISNFDTSKVTNMGNMFTGMSNLTTLDLSNFDTSSVTAMDRMFMNCNNLETLNLRNAEFTNVTNTTYMFYGAKSGMTIYTKNATTQAWLKTYNTSANVIIY
ncbi:MAG: BspA family leucine-rich repeat surface protein [Bacilli bacterium]|nr:BspA family leucine-rich repeat surface protein [Bacilli bacterium]